MCSVIGIILLDLVVQAQVQKLTANLTGDSQGTIDKLVDMVMDQTLKVWRLNSTEQDSTTLLVGQRLSPRAGHSHLLVWPVLTRYRSASPVHRLEWPAYRSASAAHPSSWLVHSSASEKDKDYGSSYKDPLTRLLGLFLPSGQRVEDPLADVDWVAPKVIGLSTEEMATRLDKGLREREWFVTGRALPELFSDSFSFSDPQVSLTGIEKYCRGVCKLFDQETARAEIVCCTATAADTITVVWRNSGKVNLGPTGFELKPYVVTTTLKTSAEDGGLVVSQEDKFDVPGWELFAYALLPSLRAQLPPPAAPVDELRKLYDPATCMPKS